jgi:hypothetical protein
MVNADLINSGDFEKITSLSREAVEIMQQSRQKK